MHVWMATICNILGYHVMWITIYACILQKSVYTKIECNSLNLNIKVNIKFIYFLSLFVYAFCMILNLQFIVVIFLIIMYHFWKSVPSKIMHKSWLWMCVAPYKHMRGKCIAWTSYRAPQSECFNYKINGCKS